MIKYLKTHLSLIIPLFVLLLSFEFFLFVNDALKKYEQALLENYSILITSNTPIKPKNLKTRFEYINQIQEINTTDTINNFKHKLSTEALQELRDTLPKFYSLKLKYLPKDSTNIKYIKNELLKYDNISRVEIFIKQFNQSNNFLFYIKNLFNIFIFFVVLISIMLIIKQINIWKFSHSRRIFIMKLFGAGFLKRGFILYKYVIIDSIVASILTSFLIYYISSSQSFMDFYTTLGIKPLDFSFILESLHLIGGSSLLAIILVSFVLNPISKRIDD